MSGNRFKIIAITFLGLALALAACEDSNAQSKAPPPKPIYTVTQRAVDGTVVMTDRAIDFWHTDAGCIRYRHPDDNPAVLQYPRIICGSPVSVKPEEK